MRPARLERATFWFVAKRSIQLSYGRQSKRTILPSGFKSVKHRALVPNSPYPTPSVEIACQQCPWIKSRIAYLTRLSLRFPNMLKNKYNRFAGQRISRIEDLATRVVIAKIVRDIKAPLSDGVHSP